MTLLRIALLSLVAAFATVGSTHAADLSVRKAAPVEFVRVCNAYGAGVLYILGTDTCLRVSGRARFEGRQQTSYSHQSGTSSGDTSGFL